MKTTIRQKRLAENIVKNAKRDKPLNKKELLVDSGYSEKTAGAIAQDIIESEGVQEELADMGFSIEGAKAVVKQLLYDKRVKATDRLKASDQVFKVLGGYAPEKHTSTNLNVNVDANQIDLQKLADDTAAKLREQKT